ncbi:MAG TPA: hypothetical protein VIC85_03070 [Ktedonobacterales bacterium]|jgi:hypothetical protein
MAGRNAADRNAADRNALRLAAALVLIGFLVAVVAQRFQTMIDGSVSSVNNHPAEFIAIASGDHWTAIALAQFLATALITAGLLVVSSALNLTTGIPNAINRLGAWTAVASLALNGVMYAVAGVALKQAVDAWVQAPVADQTARFASAESLRWLQWGVSSYDAVLFGIALLLIGIAIFWTGRVSRLVGVLIGLEGIATVVEGWYAGVVGLALSGPNAVAYDVSSALLFLWAVWLLVVALRMKRVAPAASA